MNIHYRKVIEHDIEIDIEAVIATWKKVIAGYTVNDDWPDEEETDDILESAFVDTLYYPPANDNYYFHFKEDDDDDWLNIFRVEDYYGDRVAEACEGAVAEYFEKWGLLS